MKNKYVFVTVMLAVLLIGWKLMQLKLDSICIT